MNHTELSTQSQSNLKTEEKKLQSTYFKIQQICFDIQKHITLKESLYTLKLENLRYFDYFKILIKNVHF